jgi:uncharacterized membrane protein YbhN (UPF0104 family)
MKTGGVVGELIGDGVNLGIDYMAYKKSNGSFTGFIVADWYYHFVLFIIVVGIALTVIVLFKIFGKSTPAPKKEPFENKPMFRQPV